MTTSFKYNIDSSHGLSHSMSILHFAKNIYDAEKYIKPQLKEQERVVYVSAILHDMCDKKYMKEEEGIQEIEYFLREKIDPWEINVVKKIITTMSYSKVKKDGFPQLGIYQDAYHVVREADLLTAYDFDRCMCYRLNKSRLATIEDTFQEACELFETRVFQHERDGLLLTNYAREQHTILQEGAIQQMNRWREILYGSDIGNKGSM